MLRRLTLMLMARFVKTLSLIERLVVADWKSGLMENIPRHMWQGVQLYVEQGIPPGSFLTAVLSNDLKGAFMRADEMNLAAMRKWVQFMYWDMPSDAQGSREKVEAWIAHGGLNGLQQKAQAEEANAQFETVDSGESNGLEET